MKVSVLIPNYNKKPWLVNCVQSCLDQNGLLKEIIIVDDNSTDGSQQVIENLCSTHPELIQFYYNPGKGANDARNFAFEKSSGEFIQWLDSDDYLLPGKFKNQVQTLENSQADICYSDWRMDHYVDGSIQFTETKKYRAYDDFLYQLMIDNWTSPNNYLMTRTIAEKLSNGIGWNPKTRVGQDREYFTMAGILGARFVYASGVFAVYNKQEKNTISGMEFKERLILNQGLENRFRAEISGSNFLTDNQKIDYIQIIDTHTVKACFYNSEISFPYFINPFKLRWTLMHWKMRLAMPWILLRKNLQFLF